PRADRHAGAELVGRDRLLRLGHDGPLPRDRRQLLSRALEDLRVGDRLPEAHVEDDLLDARYRHRVVDPELLPERGGDLLRVFLFQSCCHLFFVLRLQARTAPLFFATRSGLPSASRRRPTRVRTLRSGSTSITFEMWIAASLSEMPPAMFFEGFGRVWRL